MYHISAEVPCHSSQHDQYLSYGCVGRTGFYPLLPAEQNSFPGLAVQPGSLKCQHKRHLEQHLVTDDIIITVLNSQVAQTRKNSGYAGEQNYKSKLIWKMWWIEDSLQNGIEYGRLRWTNAETHECIWIAWIAAFQGWIPVAISEGNKLTSSQKGHTEKKIAYCRVGCTLEHSLKETLKVTLDWTGSGRSSKIYSTGPLQASKPSFLSCLKEQDRCWVKLVNWDEFCKQQTVPRRDKVKPKIVLWTHLPAKLLWQLNLPPRFTFPVWKEKQTASFPVSRWKQQYTDMNVGLMSVLPYACLKKFVTSHWLEWSRPRRHYCINPVQHICKILCTATKTSLQWEY